MKFGRTLRESLLMEWRFYAVDYKTMKKCLKAYSQESEEGSSSEEPVDFDSLIADSKLRLKTFYEDRESWATKYIVELEEKVIELQNVAVIEVNPVDSPASALSEDESISRTDGSANKSSSNKSNTASASSPSGIAELHKRLYNVQTNRRASNSNSAWLKDEYRRVAKSDHFMKYIYAKKSLATFYRELDLLVEFLELNETGFSKIFKKYDKVTGSNNREEAMRLVNEELPFINGQLLKEIKDRVEFLLDEVNTLKPRLPEGWEDRKIYTIGCFDLFHRGHQNVLLALREFGCYIVAGIHDDESYFKLKNKYTIDNLETRMQNVKPFVDQIYVIPSTDPLLYTQGVVSDQDIAAGSCCYVRGDDMLQFPGREWIESVMPVHFIPRTESCSSTLIRTIYHAEDESLRKKAAFAKTRYDGKPVDDCGNVLNLKV